MGLIMALFFIVIAIVGGIFLVFYPIWAIIDCVVSKKRSDINKVIWVLLMIFVWPLASYCYGLFSAKSKALRISAVIASLTILIGVTILLSGLGPPVSFMKGNFRFFHQSAENIEDQLALTDTSELSKADMQNLQEAIRTLQREYNALNISVEERKKISLLLDLLRTYVYDNHLTNKEYTDWLNRYHLRRLLDEKMLEEYIKGLNAVEI